MKKQEYWDERGKTAIFYGGEYFYTITPLPLYIKRRKILLDLLTPYVRLANDICDLGCGDGWYINYFQKMFGMHKRFVGIDASQVMLDKARLLNPKVDFYLSQHGIREVEANFQLVYTVATLAHMDDLKLRTIVESVASSLDRNNYYIIFEQVAPIRYIGNSFIRRTTKEYEDIFSEYGLEVARAVLVRFRFHQIFERYFAKYYYRVFCRGNNEHERRLNANSHFIFQSISKICLFVDRKFLWTSDEGGWGNIFMVLKNR